MTKRTARDESLLREDFLRRLEYFFLVARGAHPGPLPALRSTSIYGHGLEFADHQPYLPGDDLRYVDWNAYARHGHLLLKRFQEERDLRIDLLLDASRSMGVGSPSKFACAQRIAAALAYIGLAGMDRVSVTLFADRVLDHYPPRRGKDSIVSLLRFLESQTPCGDDTHLEQATQTISARTEGGGIAIVLSDFFVADRWDRALDRLRYRRFEIYLLQIVAPEEVEPPAMGDVELCDVEAHRRRPLLIDARAVSRYRRAFDEHQLALRDYARRHGLGLLTISTRDTEERHWMQMMRQANWLSGS